MCGISHCWEIFKLQSKFVIKIEFFGQYLQQCVLTAARRVWSIVIFLDISLSLIISCLRNATACFELKKRKKNWFDVRFKVVSFFELLQLLLGSAKTSTQWREENIMVLMSQVDFRRAEIQPVKTDVAPLRFNGYMKIKWKS